MGKFFYLILYAAFTLALIPLVTVLGNEYEGRFFPVVNQLEILTIVPDGEKSLVYVRFEKVRECEYVGIGWYEDKDGQLRRVSLNLRPDGSDSNRPTGRQVAGPWEVGIPADKLREHSYVTLTHRCNPLYLTRTDIYP